MQMLAVAVDVLFLFHSFAVLLLRFYLLFLSFALAVQVQAVSSCPMPPTQLSNLSVHPLSSKSCPLSPAVAVSPFPKPCILHHTAQCSLVSSARHSESCLPLLSGPTWQCDRSCTGTCNCPRQKSGCQQMEDHSRRFYKILCG